MYVFISHCVKEEDSLAIHAAKRNLVEELEKKRYGVFEYRKKPGTTGNWMDDIMLHLHNSDCVIYFAKNWPEPNPGVCLIEMGAAKIMRKRLFFFSMIPYKDGSPMFWGDMILIGEAIKDRADIVYTDVTNLLPILQGSSLKHLPEANPLQMLTDVFVRHYPPPKECVLDQTGFVFGALLTSMKPQSEGGIGLRRIHQVYKFHRIAGYWSIPSLQSIIALRRGCNDRKSVIMRYKYSSLEWQGSGDFEIDVPPADLLKNTFSLGPVLDEDHIWLLWHNDRQWRLLGPKLDIRLSNPDTLCRCMWRSCLQRFADGRSGLYADGKFFVIEPKQLRICEGSQPAEQEVPDIFFSPSPPQAPERVTAIAGAEGLTTLIRGGRAEAIGEGSEPGAVHHIDDTLYLGSWGEISIQEMLRCLRLPKRAVDPKQWPNYCIINKLKRISACERDSPFAWYWRCIKSFSSGKNYIEGCSYFNNDFTAPLVFEPDLSCRLNLFGDENPQPIVHCLDLAWSPDLEKNLREVITGIP